MSSALAFYNQSRVSFSDPASEESILLGLAWREDYFSYFFAYALASGRCFAPGRFGQE